MQDTKGEPLFHPERGRDHHEADAMPLSQARDRGRPA